MILAEKHTTREKMGVPYMFQVVKRDGSRTDFSLTKINDVIMKAFTATEMTYNNDIVDLLALRVTADFQSKVVEGEVVTQGKERSIQMAEELCAKQYLDNIN